LPPSTERNIFSLRAGNNYIVGHGEIGIRRSFGQLHGKKVDRLMSVPSGSRKAEETLAAVIYREIREDNFDIRPSNLAKIESLCLTNQSLRENAGI